MKHSLFLCAVIAFSSSCLSAEIKPVDQRSPVFRIYLGISGPNQQRMVSGPQLTFDAKRPLLVVAAAREVRPTPDGNGVVFALTDKDTKAFASLSRKYAQGLLILEGQGSVLSVMHITEPLDNGVFTFKDPADAAAVKYLRHRFNLSSTR